MANINMESITAKCRAWSKTQKGSRAMKDAVETLRSKGDNRVVSFAKMEELGNILKYNIVMQAVGRGVIADSVVENLQSMTVSTPYRFGTEGEHKVELEFSDNLGRPSLYPAGYPGGIENIIALFNNGMDARDHVWGMWHGHRIKSLTSFPSTCFMGDAVDDFNMKYGAANNVEASLTGYYFS